MTNTLPPVKGQPFAFPINLVKVGATDYFQETVALVAGDIQVSKDGGQYANLATFPPAEIDLASGADSGTLWVVLTGTEMNADEVTVLFRDAAGNQWQSALVTIYTSAQTLDAIGARIPAALVGGRMDASVGAMANDVITAAAHDESTAFPVKLVDTGVTKIARVGADSDTLETLSDEIAAIDVTVAISSTAAAAVASGTLGIRTHHTFSQAITSTSTSNLAAATKVWLAIKQSKGDTDAISLVFIEKTAGLVYLNGAAIVAPITNVYGSLAVSGSSGAWTITLKLEEQATALLQPWIEAGHPSEVKALVGGDTVAVWDGTTTITSGIVRAVS
jgi:hypothetical protein